METFSALLAICAVNSPHKGQWRGALMFSLICVWITGWINNREAGDLRRYCSHYDVTVMGSNTVCVVILWDCPLTLVKIDRQTIRIHCNPVAHCIQNTRLLAPGQGITKWHKFQVKNMMTSWRHGNAFRVIARLWGESPVTGGFAPQQASNAGLWCFLWRWSNELLNKLWNYRLFAMALMRCPCNELLFHLFCFAFHFIYM